MVHLSSYCLTPVGSPKIRDPPFICLKVVRKIVPCQRTTKSTHLLGGYNLHIIEYHMTAEVHELDGWKQTFFTRASFELASSEVERIVVNQMSNLSTSEHDSEIANQSKTNLYSSLHWLS